MSGQEEAAYRPWHYAALASAGAVGETLVSQVGLLSGRLEEFRLVELLQVMGLNGSTGALHLEEADGKTGIVYMESGELVGCAELDTEALTLGHVLQQLHLATAEQLERAYQLQTQDPLGKRIGERLIDLGILSPDQLAHALKAQALWTLRDLALWRSGTYAFHPGEREPQQASAPHIDSTQMIMEIVRYESVWESLHETLPEGMRTHIAMAAEPPAGHPLRFHTTAWRVISRVNSQRTVRRIATSLRQPELDVAQMIGPMVHEGVLVTAGAAGAPGLPEEAQRLSMQNFDLFTLLISMEQHWLKKRAPADQLVALAGFINQTMRSLHDACVANGLSLAPDTLAIVLAREDLTGIEGYQFRIENNRIDVDDFSRFVRRVFEGSVRGQMKATKVFYEQAMDLLMDALAAAFKAINARIASPIERKQNQEAWEALFSTFRGQSAGTF
jgi:hypothetical protein